MIADRVGKVTDQIIMMGSKESCVYLLMGDDEYALLGGGMINIIPDVISMLQELDIDEKKITQMLILHSHFDHCGIIPYFKKRWPHAEIAASFRAKDLLKKQKVIAGIDFMNQICLQNYDMDRLPDDMPSKFSGIEVEKPLKEGDSLSVGGLSMEIIETPGHSSCSIAVYVPEIKALFASDAGGIPIGNNIFTAASSNFDKYEQSLYRMKNFDIDIFLAEHYGGCTGDDAKTFIPRSIKSARKTRQILEESLSRTKDVKKSTEEITDKFYKNLPENFMPRDVISFIVSQMLNWLHKQKQI
ncbi:MBL fold metallo-hydrolase [Desulfobacterales bacterium HSG16]|nr:MBL fold metallo-hydrolase [Desulfobacterales bacterium HSG16]